jgi:uncharacterized protein (TIGR00369 family)
MAMTTDPRSTLDEWLAAEAAQRERHARGAAPGVLPRERVAALDGLAALQAMLRGELPTALIAHTLDYLLVEAGSGHAVFQGSPGSAHLNPMGTVHGGWYATLLDSALWCAVYTLMPAGRACTTTDLHVNPVRPLTPKVARVRAIGTIVYSGRQFATASARLVGPDGTLYAHGSASCLVFDLPSGS